MKHRIVALLIVGLFVTSCGSHEDKLLSSANTSPSTPAATYTWLRENLFLNSCVGCHSNQRASKNVNLITWASTIQSPNAVVPGKPESSHLYTQLRDHQMPPAPHPAVSDQMVELVKEWIESGANNI